MLGIAIYYNSDSILTPDTTVRPLVNYSLDYIAQAIAADSGIGNFRKSGGKNIYQYVRPVKRNDISNAALVFYTDASYIDHIVGNIWFRNFLTMVCPGAHYFRSDPAGHSLGHFQPYEYRQVG